ncbi:pectate lyase family protein [Xylanibacillus composti]|uniref:hypothetical protein n=1 Tax=Xylanibacillus composti TaxID=1572762 RepID=UPI001BCCA3FA|nr:hypothetical protein [Xylanibacillus composti]
MSDLSVLNVKDFGAIGDGRSHPVSQRFQSLGDARQVYPHAQAMTDEIDWCAIQGALNEALSLGGRDVKVPPGVYRTNRTIDIVSGVTFSMSQAAVISPTGDVHVVRLRKNSKLEGGKIDTSRVRDFSKAAVWLNGEDKFKTAGHLTTVSSLELTHAPMSRTGYGIYMHASGNDSSISWVHFNNVNIAYYYYGIYVHVEHTGTQQYINGNKFVQIGLAHNICGIRIDSHMFPAEASGNLFAAVECQPTNHEEYKGAKGYNPDENLFFYVSGASNYISGYFWDGHLTANKQKAVLSANSSHSHIATNLDYTVVADLGHENRIIPNFKTKNDHVHAVIPPTVHGYDMLVGNQDDYLAYAHKRFVVRQTSGPAPSVGDLSRLFDLRGDYFVRWNDGRETQNQPVSIEIQFPAPLTYAANFGMAFGHWKESPRSLRIRVYAEGEWKTVCDHRDLPPLKYFVQNYLPNFVERVEFSLAGTNDSKRNYLKIVRVFGQSTVDSGAAYLQTGGGKLYGDVDLTHYSLLLGQVAALPSASAAHRRKMVLVPGDGVNTGDTLYICLLSQDGRYRWNRVTTAQQ